MASFFARDCKRVKHDNNCFCYISFIKVEMGDNDNKMTITKLGDDQLEWIKIVKI